MIFFIFCEKFNDKYQNLKKFTKFAKFSKSDRFLSILLAYYSSHKTAEFKIKIHANFKLKNSRC